MPSLNWIGKEAVVNHDKEVPFKLLKKMKDFSVGENSENLIINGDNLEALKALMPFYYNKVKCIYIDPPYNTGNEKWIYNDNVNSLKIKQWLGKVVGKDSEDLTRHDKWLCMMYPRLKLLRELLRQDGLLFISIDDNEIDYLRILMDEIFGEENFVQQIIWKNKYGPGALTKTFGNVHEYILCYSRQPIKSIEAPLSEDEIKNYKLKDDKYNVRGGFITQPLMTRSKDDRPNLVYPVSYQGEEIFPDKQWIWEKSRLLKAIKNDEVVFNKSKDGKWSVRFKQYLRDEDGVMRKGKPISIFNGPFNQDGTWEIEEVFGDKTKFNNPKPVSLIKKLLSFVVNDNDEKDFIVLDSFAGSGTTGHAVLQLNKEDGGNRKFILVELEDHVAKEIASERIRKVVEQNHYEAGFEYCELDKPLFNSEGQIDESCEFDQFASYIYFTETQTNLDPGKVNRSFIGAYNGTEYYLIYKEKGKNILNKSFLNKINKSENRKIVYADQCLIDDDVLTTYGIQFKQIPYEVKIY